MTDEKCRVPDCYVPIMRSKDGSVRFCVSHDTLPTCSPNAKDSAVQQTSRSTNKEADQFADAAARDNEVKENKDDAALLRKRREQSSRASQIIGQKLLQRWTLLNEVCPNPECYAVCICIGISVEDIWDRDILHRYHWCGIHPNEWFA